MSTKLKRILYVLTVLAVGGISVTYYLYRTIFTSNVVLDHEKVIYIPTGSDFQQVLHVLDTGGILKNSGSFERVANWMQYDDASINAGKYTIKPGWNNKELVGVLRSGNQTPVNLVINNVRTLPDLAGKIASQIELDSLPLLRHFQDNTVTTSYGLTEETMMTMFIPNTYQVYWNTQADALLKRLKTEEEKFWLKDDREAKARELNLSHQQVYTLASIVERETQAGSERPTVAGLYINRLKNNIPLQADPTVVFATGIYDLRRVLNKHLEIDSPYNTYKYAGIPPGPIFMPSIQSLDAVLNAEKHNYLYMCARPDNSGMHAFAENITAHNQNANRYRQWLNERGIK